MWADLLFFFGPVEHIIYPCLGAGTLLIWKFSVKVKSLTHPHPAPKESDYNCTFYLAIAPSQKKVWEFLTFFLLKSHIFLTILKYVPKISKISPVIFLTTHNVIFFFLINTEASIKQTNNDIINVNADTFNGILCGYYQHRCWLLSCCLSWSIYFSQQEALLEISRRSHRNSHSLSQQKLTRTFTPSLKAL